MWRFNSSSSNLLAHLFFSSTSCRSPLAHHVLAKRILCCVTLEVLDAGHDIVLHCLAINIKRAVFWLEETEFLFICWPGNDIHAATACQQWVCWTTKAAGTWADCSILWSGKSGHVKGFPFELYDVILVVSVFYVVHGVTLCWWLVVNSACKLFIHGWEGFFTLFIYSLVFVNGLRHRLLLIWHSCAFILITFLLFVMVLSSYPCTYDLYIHPCILMCGVLTCFWTMHSSVQSLNCFKLEVRTFLFWFSFVVMRIMLRTLSSLDPSYSLFPIPSHGSCLQFILEWWNVSLWGHIAVNF